MLLIRLVIRLASVVICSASLMLMLGGCSHSLYLYDDVIDLDHVPIQYNFGRVHTTFSIDQSQWQAITRVLEPSWESPWHERHGLREALVMIERIAGEQTPTHRNLARNRANPDGDGGMDCRDESTNTTRYLALLDQHGLLRWHDIMQPVTRTRFLIDLHRGALIRDRTTQELYIVDSWYEDHGVPPRIQPLDDWIKDRDPPRHTP
jgi:hypothetical protein